MEPIISISVFTLFLIFITWKFKVLPSVSESAYRLNEKKYLFTLAMWGTGIPIILSAESGFLFLAGGAMLFVGMTTDFKDDEPKDKRREIEDFIHYISAVVIILSGHAHLTFDLELWKVSAWSLGLSVPLLLVKNKLLWIEVLNAYVLLITLIVKS